MAAGKGKSLDDIEDFEEMILLMREFGISSKGLKTLEEMKDHFTTTLGQSSKSLGWSAGQAFSILSDVQDDEVRKRTSLLSLLTEVEGLLNKLDSDEFRVHHIEHHKLQLTRKEYFVLVAGETGSGKSSLINLILGEELLPYSVLSTTSTICELKFGEERKMVAHFKDKDPETGLPTKDIPIKDCEEGYLQQISQYVHVENDREMGSNFKKVELFWPHSLLKKGIVIIDTPGVGESDIMDETVTQYLPQAFAFIYVINSANSGGIQKDRLQKLLEEVRKVSLQREGEVPVESALFVCNKWDQVPEKEADKVKNHVIKKLKACWPGVDLESQVIYMSTTIASKAQGYGFITEEFHALMKDLRFLVVKSIGSRLEIHWRWLDRVIQRIINQAKVSVKDASRNRTELYKKKRRIDQFLQAFERKQKEAVADLHQFQRTLEHGALQKLSAYISSEEVEARFTSWTLHEVPRSEGNWDDTEKKIKNLLSKRLQEFIEQWEEDNKVFANAYKSLVEHVKRLFNFFEGQLRNLEIAITADVDSENLEELLEDKGIPLALKIFIGFTCPIWIPLGLLALVIIAPGLGVAVNTQLWEERKKVKNYEQDKRAFLRKVSKEYLEDFKEEKDLEPFVKDQMKEAKFFLEQIEACLPELIEEGKMLRNQYVAETRSQKDISDRFQQIIDEGSHLGGRLAEYGFKEVRAAYISTDNLTWKEDTSSCLGRGTFGIVYRGNMKTNEEVYTIVALKMYNDVLDAKSNASLFMSEVQILRKLSHPHIVKFYGTSLLWEQNYVRVVLVLEYCKDNLRSYISKNQELIPGKSEAQHKAIRTAGQWVKEITDALAYIHDVQWIVHRDLKLENILLSEDNAVKVTDVGASKEAVAITGTFVGSPAYIAPEVFKCQVYNSKADIYSLGIMLWEIWYGERAFAKTQSVSREDFFRMVNNGGRPEHVKGCREPTQVWENLMKECWRKKHKDRPSANECHKRISADF